MKVLKSRKLFTRMAVLWFNWFTASLVSWAFTFNVDALPGNLYVNMIIFAVVDIIGAGIGYLGVRWKTFGRRLTLGLSMIGACVTNGLTIPFILFGRLIILANNVTFIITDKHYTSALHNQ